MLFGIDYEILEQLNLKRPKGIILYGPPGTGKTLMARELNKMLGCDDIKIVNGPEILDKYVGQGEANIRKLFEDAENDNDKNNLHVIVFDEFDSIAGERQGNKHGDSIVNQLLSKIDGVNVLNNILLIAMTNRIDLIDSALLRPGRFEIQLEIKLPTEEGRKEILNVHLSKLIETKKSVDIDILELAKLTINFSGADIVGLINAATSRALFRNIDIKKKLTIDDMQFSLTMDDFINSLTEIKPLYGSDDQEFIDEEYISDHKDDIMNILSNISFDNRIHKILISYNDNKNEFNAIKLGNSIMKLCDFEYKKIYNTNKHLTSDSRLIPINIFFENAKKSDRSIIMFDKLEELLEITDYNTCNVKVLSLLKSQLKSQYKNKIICVCVCRKLDIITNNIFFDKIITI